MRPRALVLACLALAPLLAHCAGDDLARTVASDRVATTSRDAEAAARLISAHRVARGLAPVSADPQLNAAAAHQARDVAEAGRLSHGAFESRMERYGVAGAAAENLTAGPTSVEGAVGRWKNSPAHNDNLLMKEARRIGLARADSPGHGYRSYWALVLAQ